MADCVAIYNSGMESTESVVISFMLGMSFWCTVYVESRHLDRCRLPNQCGSVVVPVGYHVGPHCWVWGKVDALLWSAALTLVSIQAARVGLGEQLCSLDHCIRSSVAEVMPVQGRAFLHHAYVAMYSMTGLIDGYCPGWHGQFWFSDHVIWTIVWEVMMLYSCMFFCIHACAWHVGFSKDVWLEEIGMHIWVTARGSH